ncbi:histidinol-phosphate transaminase [Methylobacter psychrophilus]|uniref:histidinol-phosphate transaminase n=1 Tax=Methylobacter psychrophilus TaxID=96941 RepID=UPI0021D4BB11|nr:histidinol-phosphate transaminase [Methylobacter psychrophilus]
MTQNNNLISAVFRKEVLAMAAYKVADASGLIKLDAMENPYGWPEASKKDWLEVLKNCQLNRYPDPEAHQLTEVIRHLNRLPEQFDLLLGNGSDEIIQLLLMALPATASVLAPVPGFVMYKQLSDCLGLNYLGIPLLAESFDLDLPAMLAVIGQHQPSVIFLAYPNNPTGNLFSETAILEIIKAAKGLVVIDEAYAPFANASFIDALGQYDNLLVMRTVSKLGLAGLRLGYIMGNPAIIEQLNKIRLPYNINSLTQISADFALSNKALFDEQTQKICAERTFVFNELNKLNGITAYPSAANFILFKTPKDKATEIFLSIKQQGVLIKNMSAQGGLLSDCLRVTIGKPEENLAFLAALRKSLY